MLGLLHQRRPGHDGLDSDARQDGGDALQVRLRHGQQSVVDPFDEIEWETRSAVIGNEKGEVVFEQRDVEFPRFWSQQATNIVVSKYFRGQLGTPERERSVKQLVGRVVDTITGWAREHKYFATDEALEAFSAELKHAIWWSRMWVSSASKARASPSAAK